VNPHPGRRDAEAAVPYPLRVAAAVSWRALAVLGMVVVVGYVLVTLRVVVTGPRWLGQRGDLVAEARAGPA